MTKHDEILGYLKETFPAGEVMPPRDYASTVAPVFPVVENYIERQLEVDRALLDDLQPPTIVNLMRMQHVAETMRDNPGKRVVVTRVSGTVLVDIEALRKK